MSEHSSKLRLHLQAEKAFGLMSVPVGKRRAKTVGGAGAPVRVTPTRAAALAPAIVVATAKAAAAPVTPVVSGAGAPGGPHPVQTRATTPVALPMSTEALTANEPFAAQRMTTAQKIERLAAMDAGEVKPCTFCHLCNSRTNTVFGEGDVDARLMFIGEGPGQTEDETGRPFVGDAGKQLDKQIAAMGLQRAQVFICNIVKCRPPENRVPVPDEMAACAPYLMRQIEIVRPQVIVSLGLTATRFLLQSKGSMSSMRGIWQSFRGIALMPTWHPAYLLRNPGREPRAQVWNDLQQVMERLGLPVKK